MFPVGGIAKKQSITPWGSTDLTNVGLSRPETLVVNCGARGTGIGEMADA